jgi:integrase
MFLEDLRCRTDAGEITPRTVGRYRSALDHFSAFVEAPEAGQVGPFAFRVNRQFALEFAAFLANRLVSPNGHANSTRHPMRGQILILDAVRAMFEWAGDPQRGGCMPEGFVNPFRRATLKRRQVESDPTCEPDITIDMAVAFTRSCDDYQLALFAPVILYGLRPSELVFLFKEHVRDGVLRVPCLPALGYTTKGRREKKLPLLDVISRLLTMESDSPDQGLLYLRRSAAQGQEAPPLMGRSLAQLTEEYAGRCARSGATTAAAKEKVRREIIREAGGLGYDRIGGEYRRIAKHLSWPRAATLKDFRHLFATTMANGGIPEHERRYLMGHAPGRGSIHVYTHMNQLAEHYRAISETQWAGVLEVIRERLGRWKSASEGEAGPGCAPPA